MKCAEPFKCRCPGGSLCQHAAGQCTTPVLAVTINVSGRVSLMLMALSPKCLRGLAFHAYAIKMFNVHHLDHIGVTNGATAKAAKGATQ